jgi:hypothetical protein
LSGKYVILRLHERRKRPRHLDESPNTPNIARQGSVVTADPLVINPADDAQFCEDAIREG